MNNELILGIVLAVVALGIIIYLNIKANQKEAYVSRSTREEYTTGITPACTVEPVQKKWTFESTVIALYLARFGLESFGPFKVFASQIKRTDTSLLVKVEIFRDLLAGNITKNATALDREVFAQYQKRNQQVFYSTATVAIGKLAA